MTLAHRPLLHVGSTPVLEPQPQAQAQPLRRQRPMVDGKFLKVNGRRFWIKGVTYGTFAPNSVGEPYPEIDQVRADFARMASAGINTVRMYTPPSNRIADAAEAAGIYLVPDICWGPRICRQLENPEQRQMIRDWTRQNARRLAGHPAILMFSIGNEIPPLMVRWYGREYVQDYLRELFDIVREEDPEALVTYANHPPCEHLNLGFLDVLSFNVYLEREPEFRAYLARLQSLAGERPVFLAEMGLDSAAHGLRAQARFLERFLTATFEKGFCGATVYAWTDEWSIFHHDIEGWAFGLTTAQRKTKPALEAVERIYKSALCDLRGKERGVWPRVSVVVATYNGAKTLARCLRSLERLRYPNYEVIVIDDGSKDQTRSLVKRYACKAIHVPNGGLSRARNLGIEHASGEIVAFIDADAYADADWLFHMVTTMQEHGAAAVGGPNLSPPTDPLVAQCVDHAPGNPAHVLLSNETAEHVPGCNMAFRKDALARIGNFDPAHRTAGDDVDVCWKLLAAQEKIAFSHAAFVWHHRRKTVRAFLKQQRGYGYAEAFLQRRYPARFNMLGDLVWRGAIYDGAHAGLRQHGCPSVFRPKVYHGLFGGAQFQSIYQPFLTWWFQIFTTFEWQVTTSLMAAAAALSLTAGHWVSASILAAICLMMLVIMLAAARLVAQHATLVKRWNGPESAKARALVAFLHIAQPLARASGRFMGCLRSHAYAHEFPATLRLWGNLNQRHQWLLNLQKQLTIAGWVAKPGSEWAGVDLQILGPGPCRATLTSVYEDYLEKGYHFVRYRVAVRRKVGQTLLAMFAVVAALSLVLAPHLLPLGLPLLTYALLVYRAKGHMVRAVSQAAVDTGAPLGMTRVEGEWAREAC